MYSVQLNCWSDLNRHALDENSRGCSTISGSNQGFRQAILSGVLSHAPHVKHIHFQMLRYFTGPHKCLRRIHFSLYFNIIEDVLTLLVVHNMWVCIHIQELCLHLRHVHPVVIDQTLRGLLLFFPLSLYLVPVLKTFP